MTVDRVRRTLRGRTEARNPRDRTRAARARVENARRVLARTGPAPHPRAPRV